ncbi:hypothetical protein ABMA27_015660 [Loxostege sticticalis]|uniref:Palmitoyltransferase n=1 Tax=Loxostege sticticalis TaxID=481309 RepID=A0ABR3I8H4_LOXSC
MRFHLSRMSWVCLYEKVQCSVILFLLTPGYFLFHMTVIRANLVALYNPGPVQHWCHFFMSCFFYINVFGNLIMATFTDTSLKKNFGSSYAFDGGTYCEICKKLRPPKSWHCPKCNVCILRRNHHCYFISRCIGMNNQRYFLLYLTYILISLVYSTYHDFFFVASEFENKLEFLVSIIPIMALTAPVVRLLLQGSYRVTDLYAFLLNLNLFLIVCFWTCVRYHWQNAIEGMTSYERVILERKNHPNARNTDEVPLIRKVGPGDWKKNLIKVFGTRWYLAILIPFADSPLPETEDACQKVVMGD